MLIGPHAAGDAVHDDAESLNGHDTQSLDASVGLLTRDPAARMQKSAPVATAMRRRSMMVAGCMM
jgi:hypothetical protein